MFQAVLTSMKHPQQEPRPGQGFRVVSPMLREKGSLVLSGELAPMPPLGKDLSGEEGTSDVQAS